MQPAVRFAPWAGTVARDDNPTPPWLDAPARPGHSQIAPGPVGKGMWFPVPTGVRAHRPRAAIGRAGHNFWHRTANYRAVFNGCPIPEPLAAETNEGIA